MLFQDTVNIEKKERETGPKAKLHTGEDFGNSWEGKLPFNRQKPVKNINKLNCYFQNSNVRAHNHKIVLC